MQLHNYLLSAIALGSWAVTGAADPPKSQSAQAAHNEHMGRRYKE
jgi:hypothetical protein